MKKLLIVAGILTVAGITVNQLLKDDAEAFKKLVVKYRKFKFGNVSPDGKVTIQVQMEIRNPSDTKITVNTYLMKILDNNETVAQFARTNAIVLNPHNSSIFNFWLTVSSLTLFQSIKDVTKNLDHRFILRTESTVTPYSINMKLKQFDERIITVRQILQSFANS